MNGPYHIILALILIVLAVLSVIAIGDFTDRPVCQRGSIADITTNCGRDQ